MNQLCQLASAWRVDHPPPGAFAEIKVDGWRAVYAAHVDGSRHLFTRNGYPIPGAEHVLHRLETMEAVAGQPLVIDGEFQVGGSLTATKLWCESGYKMGGNEGTFFAFDVLTLTEWRNGGSDAPLWQRKQMLEGLWHAAEARIASEWTWAARGHGIEHAVQPVRVLPHDMLFTREEVIERARLVWSMGLEGLVLKEPESPYQRKRSPDWLKVNEKHKERLGFKLAA